MVERLEQIVKDSVSKSLLNIKRPFGLFLSGGVDSGTLAALTKPDIVFTARFPYGEIYDEFEKHLADAVNLYKPTSHFSLVPLYMLFKRAKELGITTILSGEGPDEYLGGYTSYAFIAYEQKLYMRSGIRQYKYALDKYWGTPMERFAKILGKDPKELEPYWGKYKFLLSRMGYTDLHLRGIEEMELALAKGFGINLVYPYMTKEMEEFCFTQVLDNSKIKFLGDKVLTKFIFKKIAEKYIPYNVAWRGNKMGGPVAPIGKWLNSEGVSEFDKTAYLKLQNKLWKSQA